MKNNTTECFCGAIKPENQNFCYVCNEFLKSTDDLTERIEYITQKIKNNDFRQITSDGS